MKVIIAGSRTIKNLELVETSMKVFLPEETDIEVVCGGAEGIDLLGEQWAKKHGYPVTYFHAKWKDIEAPNSLIKTDKWGRKYNAKAGLDRNTLMAQYADTLVLIWTGCKRTSRGSWHMYNEAKKFGLTIYEVNLKN